MLVATVGQGCLPTYASGSDMLGMVGLVVLILLRVLQGLSAGGEVSSFCTYISEVAEPASLGRSIAVNSIGGNIDFFLAKAVVFLLSVVLGETAFADWGRRLPFLVSLVPGLVAVWGRRKVPEPGAYAAEKDRSFTPAMDQLEPLEAP